MRRPASTSRMATVRRSGSELVAGLALIALAALGSACEPTCKNTCEKLLECGDGVETPRASLDDCEYSCEVRQDLYEDNWENEHLRNQFGEMKQCIADEECAAIAEGACYDDELFIW